MWNVEENKTQTDMWNVEENKNDTVPMHVCLCQDQNTCKTTQTHSACILTDNKAKQKPFNYSILYYS